jgi:hypothetical protein
MTLYEEVAPPKYTHFYLSFFLFWLCINILMELSVKHKANHFLVQERIICLCSYKQVAHHRIIKHEANNFLTEDSKV